MIAFLAGKNTEITFKDFAEDNMSIIEPFGFHGRDEELTAVGIFA